MAYITFYTVFLYFIFNKKFIFKKKEQIILLEEGIRVN